MKSIRAIVYGLGNVNRIAARLMHEKGIQLVGAVNRSGPKVGQDVGILAGIGRPLGVSVSADAEAVLSTPADVVVVAVCDDMRRGFPIYKHCLEKGHNVVTVGAFMSHPWRATPEPAAALDATAKAHGVTLFAGGNQDFFMVNVGLVMSGVCHRIQRIVHRSLSDINIYGAEVAELMSVGRRPDTFDEAQANQKPSVYLPFWESVVDELEMHIRDIHQTTRAVVTDKSIFCKGFGRTIKSGQIIGLIQQLDIDTQEGLALKGENTLRLLDPDEAEYKQWIIEGEPDVEITANRLDTAFTTASQAVNRIPDVINAQPGYIRLKQLPKMIYRPKPFEAYLKQV